MAAIPLLFAIMIVPSVAAFFCVSRVSRVLSATNLPLDWDLLLALSSELELSLAVKSQRGKGAAWLTPCVCVLSGCSVDILQCVCEEHPFFSNQCVLW